MQIREIELGLGESRFQFQGLKVVPLCLGKLPAVTLCITQIVVCLGEIGLDGESLLERHERFVTAASLQQCVTQVVPDLGVLGVALDGVGMMAGSLCPPMLTCSQHAECIVDTRPGLIKAKGCFQGARGDIPTL